MSLESTIVTAISSVASKHITERFIKSLNGHFGQKVDYLNISFDIGNAISRHCHEISNWCSIIQVLGMTEPKYIDDITINTHLTSIPRKFGRTKERETIEEDHLLSNTSNFPTRRSRNQKGLIVYRYR